MVLDDIFGAVANVLRRAADLFGVRLTEERNRNAKKLVESLENGEITVTDPDTGEEATVSVDAEGGPLKETLVTGLGSLPDGLEQTIINELPPDETRDPGEVREAIKEAEGVAVGELAGAIATSVGIELLGGTQVESHQVPVAQILGALAIDSLVGLELEAVAEEGVQPALTAEINREYRSQFVDLPDHVEDALRQKDSDEDWLDGVAKYGIREEEEGKLERVAIEQIEAEELVESPVQFGVVPSPDLTRQELDRAGVSEDVKDLFVETVDAAAEISDLWEQRTFGGVAVEEASRLVEDGLLSPDQAMELVRQSDVPEEALPAINARLTFLSGLPGDTPTGGEIDRWHREGVLSTGAYQGLLDQLSIDRAYQAEKIEDNIIRQDIDGIREAAAFGRISRSEARERLTTLGVAPGDVPAVLSGQLTKDAIIQRELSGGGGSGDGGGPVTDDLQAIPGIGPARESFYVSAGLRTFADLANASVDQLTQAPQVTDEDAEAFIRFASQFSSGQ